MTKETNIEWVTRVMDYCPTGALGQALIIEAIGRYAEEVAKAPVIDHPLIDGDAWKRTGMFIRDELNKHLKG